MSSKFLSNPLMSWDISNPNYNLIDKRSVDLKALNSISVANNWDVDFVKELSISYQTLILTDLKQTILWVNHGFPNHLKADSGSRNFRNSKKQDS